MRNILGIAGWLVCVIGAPVLVAFGLAGFLPDPDWAAQRRRMVEQQLRAAGSMTPSFATHIFTGLDPDSLDSSTHTARVPMPVGTSVMFDFGGVVDGYCSDFGRTIVAHTAQPCGPSEATLERTAASSCSMRSGSSFVKRL